MPASYSRRLPRARHEHLLRELELRGSVRSSSIAAELGVAEMTIRRDIIALEQAGRLARVHGGAISAGSTTRPEPARSQVGLVLPGSGSHFPDIARGVELAAKGHRARVVLASTNYRSAVENRQVERLVELGIDGLIIAPTLRSRTIDDVAMDLADVPVPVVFVERRLDESSTLARHDWVCTDHARGTLHALQHFTGLGHRSVGLALLDRTPTAPSIREGYVRAAARLDLDSAPVQSLPKDDGGEADPADRVLHSFLDACLENGTRAALVHTDYHATRLIEIALDRGISVPDEFAVIAYDDEFAELGIVPLTAVSPPGREIGRLALESVFERIRDAEPGGIPPRHIQVVPRLTVRRSCGAAAPADR